MTTDFDASWDAFVAEGSAVPFRVWVNAFTKAVAKGTAKPDALGYALMFTNGGFNWDTGRQEQPKSLEYLAEGTAYSRATWSRQLKYLRDEGWLTASRWVLLPGAVKGTPLHVLTVPKPQM